MERKWLAIGQIAKRSGVKASALRFYEQKGLIRSVRSDGGSGSIRRMCCAASPSSGWRRAWG
nr:MerR family DNA-binding transcriptional regulator [Aeromonas dhakensis]